jgi:hypothetical protein
MISPDNTAQDIIDTLEAQGRQAEAAALRRHEATHKVYAYAAGADRAKAAEDKSRAAREAQAQAAGDRHASRFAQDFPAQAAWIARHLAAPGFDFPAKMLAEVRKFGRLTAGQMAAIDRCIAREAERANRGPAPTVDAGSLAALRECFDRAAKVGARGAFLRLALVRVVGQRQGRDGKMVDITECDDAFQINAAPEHGKNPGALYVKRRDPATGEFSYAGKVQAGAFRRVRECSDAAQANFVKLCADPATAAVAYGKHFATCAICGQTLSNEESVARGIGPICAAKFGW